MHQVRPRSRRLRLIVSVVTIFLVLLAGTASWLTHSQTASGQTRPSTGDPMVGIVVDATNPTCMLALTRNVGTPSAVTTWFPCTPYTDAKTMKVRRSAAIAAHEPYVLVPGAGASASDWEQARAQLGQIAAEKASAARGGGPGAAGFASAWPGLGAASRRSSGLVSALPQARTIPATCYPNTTEELGHFPTINSDSLYEWFDFNTNGDCSQLTFLGFGVQGYTSVSPLYWWYAQYEGTFGATKIIRSYIGTNTLHWICTWSGMPFSSGYEVQFGYQSANDGSGQDFYDYFDNVGV